MAPKIPKSPANIAIGEVVPILNTRGPELSKSELERRQRLDVTNPDVITGISGHLMGFVTQKGRKVPIKDLPPNIKYQYENTTEVLVVKVYVIESDRMPHFEEEIRTFDDKPVNPELLIELCDDFIAVDDKVTGTDWPDVGDFVYVDYDNRITRTGPRYYGLKYKATNSAGTKKDKKASDASKERPSLDDTTQPPSSGSPLPTVSKTQPQQSSTPFVPTKQPGFYPVYRNSTVPYGELEMVTFMNAWNTVTLLFPRIYYRAFQEMQKAFEEETQEIFGKPMNLGVVSAYRDVELQRSIYNDWLKCKDLNPRPRGCPPAVAKPGFSKHQNGVALDLATDYKKSNDKFDNLGVLNKTEQQAALERVKAGEFGPIAQWLTENSQRFGFVWTGYSFRELWHYEFDVELGKSLGLVDE